MQNLERQAHLQEVRVAIRITDEIKISSKVETAILRQHLEKANELIDNIEKYSQKIIVKQDYEVFKDGIFTDYLLDLDAKTYWINVIQMVVVILWSAWIIISLKNFLKNKY